MSRDGNKSDNRNKRSRSQSKLALALLLILVLFVAFLTTDSPFISGLRGSFYEKLGLVQSDEEDEEEPGTVQNTNGPAGNARNDGKIADIAAIDPDALPEYDGHNYVTVGGSVPVMPDEVYTKAGLVRSGSRWKTDGTIKGIDSRKLTPYEYYGKLDNLGRCTVAYGCLGYETMPEQDEKRGDISSIHPSGWAKAQNWERAHLIAWALSNENANASNLITGTHYLNYDGMRPIEEEVEHYIWNTGNHVLYYVEPVFSGRELIARGVNMIAWSVEDEGDGISYNVYCFNVTPGAAIDYNTGIVTTAEQAAQDARLYVINTRSGVFHYPTCEGAGQISKRNRKEVTATRLELTNQGYTPCGYCEP